MTTQDYEYYRRRESQERMNADRTGDKGARRVHLEMADRYAEMLRDAPRSVVSVPTGA